MDMNTASTTAAKLRTFVTKSEDQSDAGDNEDRASSESRESTESRDEEDSSRNEASLKWSTGSERDGNEQGTHAASDIFQLPTPSTSFDPGPERRKASSRNIHSTQTKCSPRSPPSARNSVLQDESPLNLLNNTFDTFSESYLREMHSQSPTPNRAHHGLLTTRNCDVEIFLPFLSATGSAMEDISPLKDNIDPLPYNEGSPLEWILNPLPMMPTHTTQKISSPFYVLGSCRQAFEGCTFQIPSMFDSRLCGSFKQCKSTRNNEFDHYSHTDLVIAQRRVKAAICAFGGNSVARPFPMNDRDFIFRHRSDDDQQQASYENKLQRRYFMNGNRISWDVEEDPPLHDAACVEMNQGHRRGIDKEINHHGLETPVRRHIIPEMTPQRRSPILTDIPTLSGTEMPKMKYRCKLCGQPKMSHVCPYRQSVQRNIGIQVYPTANPFAANEPGYLAPTLTDMNNTAINDFNACNDSDDGDDSAAQYHFEGEEIQHSPPCVDIKVLDSRKRSYDEMNDRVPIALPQGPFAEEAPVHPEQYRTITPVSSQPTGLYQYQAVALTFNERKKLSDTLYVMTQSIQQLSQDCANILRDARERCMWDLAVAELLTQIVVAMHCQEGDKCLDGLQQYLLHLGIAC